MRKATNTHRSRRRCAGLPAMLTLILFICAPLLLCDTARAGSVVRYEPLAGNLELDEGTIELWLTPLTDVWAPTTQTSETRLHLFHITRQGPGLTLSLLWRATRTEEGVTANNMVLTLNPRTQNGGPLIGPIIFTPANALQSWQQGQMHYVAVRWKGAFDTAANQNRRIVVTDLLVDQHPSTGGSPMIVKHTTTHTGPFTGSLATPVARPLATAKFHIGDPNTGTTQNTKMIVHAVHISSTARDVVVGGPIPLISTSLEDRFTLMLDIFDQDAHTPSTGVKVTRPILTAWGPTPAAANATPYFVGGKAAQYGRLFGDYHFIAPGNYAAGFALYKAP